MAGLRLIHPLYDTMENPDKRRYAEELKKRLFFVSFFISWLNGNVEN
jgi:hypothetical protein